MTTPQSAPPQPQTTKYQQIHNTVQAEFTIEEALIEHDIPTFHITLQPNSKQAFLRLYKQLTPMGLTPILRKHDNKHTLKIIPKPSTTPTNKKTNIALFLATTATLLITGYIHSLGWPQQDPLTGAVMFTTAMIAMLGAHEMAHKIAANKHKIEATYPYFIPGTPPLGTFGAVIQQKSLAPNRDALFDLGMSGPVAGFVITMFVTILGVQLSQLTVTSNGETFILPMFFDLIITLFPPSGQGNIVLLHPVAYAGYIYMIITMLNLLPTGMLDGGHVIRVLLGDKTRTILSYIAILAMLLMGAWLMAILVFFLSQYPHPGSLDDVSKLSNSRKLATIVLIAIFALSVAPLYPL